MILRIISLPNGSLRPLPRKQLYLLLHRRKLRRGQETGKHPLINWPILLAIRPRLGPFGVRKEGIPLLLSVGKGFPGQHVR